MYNHTELAQNHSTFSAIAAWAARVQPGSPASSFLHIVSTPTTAHIVPTPSARDFKPDLTAVGYTSVFLQLPNTPISATLAFPAKAIPVPPLPSPARKPCGLTRFRSLSVLRSRGRTRSAGPESPTKARAKASAAIVKRKKAKYAMRPPPLANELALMQFVDGGSMEDTIQRAMESQAKITGAAGVSDVYRDGKDGIWLDQDEEMEYAHLLAEGDYRPRATGDPQWVTFGPNASPMACIPADDRRGSVSTQDSDLNPNYLVQPIDVLGGDDLTLCGSTETVSRRPSVVLTLPCRPRRAKHLRKPDFLVDVAFSRTHSPRTPKSPLTPVGLKPRGKARRRPAPLKLCPPSPAWKRPTNSPIDPERVRQDFIEASFEPMLMSPLGCTRETGRTVSLPRRAVHDGLMSIKKKPSMLNVMALFRSGKKEGLC